jgi:hypothetical protein
MGMEKVSWLPASKKDAAAALAEYTAMFLYARSSWGNLRQIDPCVAKNGNEHAPPECALLVAFDIGTIQEVHGAGAGATADVDKRLLLNGMPCYW